MIINDNKFDKSLEMKNNKTSIKIDVIIKVYFFKTN